MCGPVGVLFNNLHMLLGPCIINTEVALIHFKMTDNFNRTLTDLLKLSSELCPLVKKK